MSLAVHRPARLVSSLVADDPVELAADLPRLLARSGSALGAAVRWRSVDRRRRCQARWTTSTGGCVE
jgi:hypothetical protein